MKKTARFFSPPVWVLVILILFTFTARSLAGDVHYPVSEIPVKLKENMYAVIRDNTIEYRIVSSSDFVLHTHYVITVLNENGERSSWLHVPYDKLIKVNFIKGALYDANGDLIQKIKQSDIHDHSRISDISLYQDDRVKAITLESTQFPYTVEYDYEVESKVPFNLACEFNLFEDDEISVQNAHWSFLHPRNYDMRLKTFNIGDQPIEFAAKDGSVGKVWNFENAIPEKWENDSPDLREIVPTVMIGFSGVDFSSYSGSLDTWKSMGLWQRDLNRGRDDLPDATIATVHALTDGLSSADAKAKALYEYLQKKTRYVNISLGIGGWQPFTAAEVDETGYGDCKALSNYMVALLKTAGIKAYFTLVSAGADAPRLVPDFPDNYFNHVIVSIPESKDTLWLECTNQQVPFGYLGKFTSDRRALMITDDGGALVRTVVYPEQVNTEDRTALVSLDAAGNAKVSVKTTYHGLAYETGGLAFILDRNYDDQRTWVLENTQIPTFDINRFTLSAVKEKIPSATAALDLTLNRFASVSGKRLFFTPNLMNKLEDVPRTNDSRKTDYVERYGSVSNDTIEFRLPEGMNPEYIPQPVILDAPFGHYEATVQNREGALIYTRQLVIHKGRYPPSQYPDLADFYRKINRADNQKVILLSKT